MSRISRVEAPVLVPGGPPSPLPGDQVDQRADDDRHQRREQQVAAVGRDDPCVPAAQRTDLVERAPAHRCWGPCRIRPAGHRGERPRPGDVLLADRRARELGGPVPVGIPVEGLEHLGPAGLAEVAQPFLRWPEERDLPAGDQDQQPVAHVEVGHTVRDHDDGPAVVREVAHLLHDRLVEPRVETGRWLVQEQQRRLSQQLQGHVDPLELAAGQLVGTGIRVPGQGQLAHDLLDPGVPLAGVGVGRKTQLGGVPQRPLRGELRVHDAVLRDQADPGP